MWHQHASLEERSSCQFHSEPLGNWTRSKPAYRCCEQYIPAGEFSNYPLCVQRQALPRTFFLWLSQRMYFVWFSLPCFTLGELVDLLVLNVMKGSYHDRPLLPKKVKVSLLTRICAAANSRKYIDIHSLQCLYSLDMLQAYRFGCLGMQDYVSNTGQRERCLDNYFVKSSYLFWINGLPLFLAFSGCLGTDIVPSKILQSQDGLEASILEACEKAELLISQEALESDARPVYKQAYTEVKDFRKPRVIMD